MLNKKTKIIIFISILFVILMNCNIVNAAYISQLDYSEEYKEWLALPEDERNKIIAPKMFDIDVNISENNLYTKIKTLMNSVTNSSFDLRSKISNNLKIRNQGNTNACWAFATLSSLETNLAMQDNSKIYDYSESHMDYSTSQSFTDGKLANGFTRDVAVGGNFQIGSAYLTNGSGAILEEDMTFVNTKEKISIDNIQNKNVVTKVTDTEEFNFANSIKDNNMTSIELDALIIKMKEHIKTNGSISAGIHGASLNASCYNNSKGAIYCKDESKCNMDHNVSIIGWDDTYSRGNFNQSPNKDGAWIIRNSWGTEMNGTPIGDDGFMYVSYEDVNIYKQLFGIEKATENVDYDKIYQYSELGYNNALALGDGIKKIYISNVFSRDKIKNEELIEVSLNVIQKVRCKVYVNPNGSSKNIKDLVEVELEEGKTETFDAGYHTLEFKNLLHLTGNEFTVVIEIEALEDNIIYSPVLLKTTGNFWDNVELKEDANYITYGEFFEKNEWIDVVKDASLLGLTPCNLTIKAFTREAETVQTPTPTPTPTVTVKPTINPTPTQKPAIEPTPTVTPTTKPTQSPTNNTPSPTIEPTKIPTSEPTSTSTTKPTSQIMTPQAKPTSTPSNNSGILGSINTNSAGNGSTMTSHSSLPYVGKTEILFSLIIILSINIVIVYRKYKKIY